jgi:tetratricopeptide (TPR) repeat protein
MINAHEILEKARGAGQRLPYNEAAVLFAAAVRLAAANDSTIRAHLVQIDEAGGLHLEGFDEEAPEPEPAYLAPELLTPDAPDKTDPKVQVYAAGMLGYELLTGKLPLSAGQSPGAELSGPLAEVIGRSLSIDRRTRIEDLRELQEAVEAVQPRPPAEGERNILSALRNRFSRPPPEKEALAKAIDRLQQLEAQVAQLGKAQARVEGAQRESLEAIERFEDGQRRAGEAGRRQQSVVAPAVIAALFASAAVVGGAWALGLLGGPALSRRASQPPAGATSAAAEPAQPAAVPAAAETPSAAQAPAVPDASVAAPETKSAQIDAGGTPAETQSLAVSDAGEADAGLAAAEDAGAAQATAAPSPAEKKRPVVTPRAAMAHAVALSQVRRGEAALEQGRSDEALASFRAALDNEPTNADAFRGLGMAYAMQGNDAQALQAYDKYLRLAPKAPDAAEIRQSIRELKERANSAAQ